MSLLLPNDISTPSVLPVTLQPIINNGDTKICGHKLRKNIEISQIHGIHTRKYSYNTEGPVQTERLEAIETRAKMIYRRNIQSL